MPFPVQGFSYNGALNVLYAPVVFDWVTTLLAQIDIDTGIATPVDGFQLTRPETLFAAGYDNSTGTFTMAVTSDWPIWNYQTFDFGQAQIIRQGSVSVADENFYIRSVCLY